MTSLAFCVMGLVGLIILKPMESSRKFWTWFACAVVVIALTTINIIAVLTSL